MRLQVGGVRLDRDLEPDQSSGVFEPAPPPLRLGASRTQPRVAYALPHLAAALAARLQRPVITAQRDGYEHLLDGFLGGAIDVAWLPPLLLARASGRGGQLLAVPMRAGTLTYRSALLVAAGSPLHELSELRGVRAAWVDHWSASGYHFPRLELERRGLVLADVLRSEVFHGSTVRAASAVAAGEADLCACFVTDSAAHDRFLAAADLRRALGPLAERLRVLHVTQPIPPDGLVAASHVPGPVAVGLADAFQRLHHAPDGQEVLRNLLQAERLCAPTDAVARSLDTWSAVGG